MKTPIIIALDFAKKRDAQALLEHVDPSIFRVKVGLEMFTRFGQAWVKSLIKSNFEVFLDLKFHDIPNTVAQACLAAADLGVWMMNVHVLGGRAMLAAAANALDKVRGPRPLLLGMTLLTSLQEQDLPEIGVQGSLASRVYALAKLAQQAGLDGVVCSGQEARELRQKFGDAFTLVTPGIRPEGSDIGDQVRIMTPKKALQEGATYLVIGRPVTQAKDPLQVLEQIRKELH